MVAPATLAPAAVAAPIAPPRSSSPRTTAPSRISRGGAFSPESSYLTTRPDDDSGLPANVVVAPSVPSAAMGQLLID